MVSTAVEAELDRLRHELERLRGEAERLRTVLAQRPQVQRQLTRETQEGVAARDLLASIADALDALGQGFFSQYGITSSDLLKLVALCEDDAARAGPLVNLEASWFGNTIRKVLLLTREQR